jgi:hypothetical protein
MGDIRAVFAAIGVVLLFCKGVAIVVEPTPGLSNWLIDFSSVGTVLLSLWRLLKGACLVGASVALVRIWVEAVETRENAAYSRRKELEFRQAVAEGEMLVDTKNGCVRVGPIHDGG